MLKLDPDDVESEEEMYDKSKLNSTMLTDITPTTSVLNSTGAYQSPNESGASGTINMTNLSSPNFGNRSKNHIFSTPTPIKVSTFGILGTSQAIWHEKRARDKETNCFIFAAKTVAYT